MGDFRIVINAVGGHGCDRNAKDGERAMACGRMGCPDCEARRFVAELQLRGIQVNSAELVHWPKDSPSGLGGAPEIVDNLLTGIRKGAFAVLLMVAAFAALLFPMPAFAQAVVEPGIDQLASQLADALTTGNWGLVAVVAVVLVVQVLRGYGGQFIPALKSKWAGILLPLIGSIGAAILTAMVGGVPLTAGLIVKSLILGLASNGLFSTMKNAGEAAGVVTPKPVPAVDPASITNAQAVEVLQRAGRGPQP